MKNYSVLIFALLTLFVGQSYAQELYTLGNAANIGNESNGTSGWTEHGMTTVGFISEVDGSSNYSISVTGNSGTGFNAARTTLTGLTNGTQYYVVIRARNDVGNTSNGSFFAWSGIQETINTSVTSTNYQEYSFLITSNGNDLVMTSYACICNDVNNKVYISSISVQEVQSNLHTNSNAASISNEANSVLGWGGSATESSVSTEAFSGAYSIKIESPNNGWNYTAYSFATTANEQYIISFYAKSASTTNPGLYWGGGGVVENQKIDITSSNWTQYTKTVTAAGSTINLNVYPGTPALTGESVYIDHVSIVPLSTGDSEAPTPPTLTSTGQTSTTVDLTWSGATDNVGVTQYKVYKDNALVTTLGTVTTYQMTGLTAGTTYSFAVRALDAAGNQSMASNLSVTTDSSTDTQAPTAPALTSGSNTDTTVNLSWSGATDNVGVTGYKVYKDGIMEASLGNVGTYQATGLTASTAYNFTVTALDAAGNESTSSNQVPVTTNAASGGGGSSSVWTESTGVASYNGDVGIGTTSVPTGYKLAVEGKIRTREVRVDQDTWPDYVFTKEYRLPTLEEIRQHIEQKGHLPNIPSAQEVQANGVELGEMNRLLLEKIEELTLHILQLEVTLTEQKQINGELSKRIEKLEEFNNNSKKQ